MTSLHKNNFRRQRRLESRLGETVRIASIVQKGMATGRSSYVEMRALDRLTNHNIKTRVEEIKKSIKLDSELQDLLSKIPPAMSDGYAKVLTPNGIIREAELDHLLSIDGDIVTCLVQFESEQARDVIDLLKELMEERQRLADSLKA